MRSQKFFGMIIPKKLWRAGFFEYRPFGGRAAALHGQRRCRRDRHGAPNSLGPGELLVEFGTQEQPRSLAAAPGRRVAEIPVSGSLSADAGSDAACHEGTRGE